MSTREEPRPRPPPGTETGFLVETELVDLAVSLDADAVLTIDLNRHARRGPESSLEHHVARELAEYFVGARRRFEFAIAPCGSSFDLCVWEALQTIPYGHTRTYGEVAELIGSPGGARAVGAANGRNPIPIVIPCHRVVAAGGKLGGYGGGLELKRRLLDLETRHAAPFAS